MSEIRIKELASAAGQLDKFDDYVVYPSINSTRASGLSVRCIKE